MGLWISICVGLFTWKFIQYRNRAAYDVMGYCVTTAKGAAETLKFNMALILLPVCRNTITWLRSTKLGVVVPFDDNINFHKVCHNLEFQPMSIECRQPWSILASQITRETKLCQNWKICQTVFSRDLILELIMFSSRYAQQESPLVSLFMQFHILRVTSLGCYMLPTQSMSLWRNSLVRKDQIIIGGSWKGQWVGLGW